MTGKRAKPGDAKSVARAFQRLAAELLGYVLASQRLYHVLFREAGVSEEETMAPLRHLVLDALRQAMEQGAVRPMDPDVLMRFLVDGRTEQCSPSSTTTAMTGGASRPASTRSSPA